MPLKTRQRLVINRLLEKTPFRRGTETLIKKLREDDQRRRRFSTDEELRL